MYAEFLLHQVFCFYGRIVVRCVVIVGRVSVLHNSSNSSRAILAAWQQPACFKDQACWQPRQTAARCAAAALLGVLLLLL